MISVIVILLEGVKGVKVEGINTHLGAMMNPDDLPTLDHKSSARLEGHVMRYLIPDLSPSSSLT